jgi:hypothetical protein
MTCTEGTLPKYINPLHPNGKTMSQELNAAQQPNEENIVLQCHVLFKILCICN